MYARQYGVAADSAARGVYLTPLMPEEVLGYSYGVRGELHCRNGDYGDGLRDLRRASFMYPRSCEIRNLLAWTLATCPRSEFRDGSQAVEMAQSLLQMDCRANWLDTLASAYAERGEFGAAVKAERHARDLASSPGATARDVGLDYDGLIAAYERHITYAQHRLSAADKTRKSLQAQQ